MLQKSVQVNRKILATQSDIFRTQIPTRIKFGQASASDKSPVTGKKYMKRVENKYSLWGPSPFLPNYSYTEIWFWGWKNGKSNMKAEGNKVSILKTMVHSHFFQ